MERRCVCCSGLRTYQTLKCKGGMIQSCTEVRKHVFVYHRSGIQLVQNSKVQSVARNSVQINTNGKISTIAFGACVWSTGSACTRWSNSCR